MEKTNYIMTSVNVMDIETYEKNGRVVPYCICFKYLNTYHTLWGGNNIVVDFIEKLSILSESDKIEIYTHNINFDGLVILEGIKDKNISYDLFIRDYNIYWVKVMYFKIVILIRCSYKLIPLSVKMLGNMIGNYKYVFPHHFVNELTLDYVGSIPPLKYFNTIEDYNVFKIDHIIFNLKEVSISYCKQDVEIVHIVLSQILSLILLYGGDNRILNTSFSFSSVSYKIFIKKYDRYQIDHNKITVFHYEYFKNAYYGGRCEVFGNPNNKLIHYFDFAGMYAQCMLELFPIGKTIIKHDNLNINDIGFHTITFECNDYLPFLPCRHDKLLFPNGVIVGTYWYEEILHAISHKKCKLIAHHSSIVYDSVDYVFKEFVENFNEVRKKGVYYKIFGKNMNNGLYGSFALNETNDAFVVCLNDTEFESYCKHVDIKSFVRVGSSYIIKIEKTEKSGLVLDKKKKWTFDFKKRNVAYAAIIASKARIKLNTALNNVIDDGGELYYTDTDSIFAGYDKSYLNCELGEIKWNEVYEDGVFISSKFYHIKNQKIKLKGVNISSYDFDEIKKKFYDDHDSIIFDGQLNFERKNFILLQKKIEKEIKLSGYDKRIFAPNKLTTQPILINQTNSV